MNALSLKLSAVQNPCLEWVKLFIAPGHRASFNPLNYSTPDSLTLKPIAHASPSRNQYNHGKIAYIMHTVNNSMTGQASILIYTSNDYCISPLQSSLDLMQLSVDIIYSLVYQSYVIFIKPTDFITELLLHFCSLRCKSLHKQIY